MTDKHTKSGAKWQIFLALEDLPRAHGLARAFGIFLLFLIVVNALLVGTSDAFYMTEGVNPLFIFNLVSTVVFALEYAMRIWIANDVYPSVGAGRARLKYIISPLGLIDLLSFAPMVLLFFVPYSAAVLDAVRVIRLIRLIKVTRYMRGLQTIAAVFRKRQREIIAAFMVLALLCIASSVLMYEAEHASQPENFDSVLTGLYWAMTTMTSTGYGDLVPITPIGRLIGFLTMALSIGVVAIPAGIFSAGFVAEFKDDARSDKDSRSDDDSENADIAGINASDGVVVGDGSDDAEVGADIMPGIDTEADISVSADTAGIDGLEDKGV